jgi:hypothetical protein
MNNISNAGPGPRCTVCQSRAVYELFSVQSVYVYALTREGERHRMLSERRPVSHTRYYCVCHARPFLPTGNTP